MTKILVLRFSSIGDIVLTTPVVRALKQQLPGAQIHYATKYNFRSLVESNPYIDQAHYLRNNLGELIKELQAEKFDYVVDLHRNLRTSLLKFKLGVPAKSFDKLNFKKWLLVRFKINKLPNIHIVERYLAAATHLGVTNDGQGLDYFIPAADEVALTSLPVTHQNGYYAFAIGAQHYTKRLPTERIIELCAQINAPVILLGGKEDQAAAAEITNYFKNRSTTNEQRTTIYNACGQYNLNQSASLVKQAQAVFSHDTGLMHIAAAFQKKIFSIWGNTVPEFGMYPYKTEFKVWERPNLYCRPCSKIGYSKCPQGHFKCMREINFDITLT
ncbi:glycosyltransferase family 9 protein [Adhaeribacter pallidiroseus]|uniref:ADP-heptose--LPS heptosyltransferase n=1 Tax=Adhaeribacter pallidiroseus TaxID=2072847 RepID=A0A369QM57_9BACT|nr:glycosyltransferase family 9 protein [Adhaeribacter pallidiroseus]RDC64306.1 ADP-heptose--LPS heptosyltransferase [Adhaeribacter pallidiroseus]